MNIVWKISTIVLAIFFIVSGLVCIIPGTRQFILNSVAPYSEVYKEQANENKELQDAYISNLVLLAETRTSLLNAEFKSISYQNEVGVLQSNLQNTQNNLALALSQKTTVENTLNDTNANLVNITQNLNDLRVEFNELNSELDALIEQESNDTDRINELTNELQSVSAEMSSLQNIVSGLTLASNTYEAQIADYETQIANCNRIITDYESEIISLRSQIIELQETIRELESLNSALNGDDSYKELVQQVISGTLTELRASDLDGITEIRDYAFYNCYSLRLVELPESVNRIGAYAFANCFNLETIVIPDNVQEIGQYAFKCCSNLQIINLPEGIYVGNFAFYQSGIRELHLPASVSNWGECVFQEAPVNEIYFEYGATRVPFAMFNGCMQINNVYLPVTMQEIANLGFSMHSMNMTVLYAGTEEEFNNIMVIGENSAFVNAYKIYNYTY